MSIALDHFCLTKSVAMPIMVLLSVTMGVGGCGCPISSRAMQIGVASLPLRNNAANSNSVGLEHASFRICVPTWIAPLGVGWWPGLGPGFCTPTWIAPLGVGWQPGLGPSPGFLLGEGCPADRERALASDGHEASLLMCGFMLLPTHLMIVLGCVVQ